MEPLTGLLRDWQIGISAAIAAIGGGFFFLLKARRDLRDDKQGSVVNDAYTKLIATLEARIDRMTAELLAKDHTIANLTEELARVSRLCEECRRNQMRLEQVISLRKNPRNDK